eukprot:PhF_6_TR7199/c0_g1_i2/m.10763/K01056/PTH1, pth, spoVC; peptidyl-tRNA hydrolase, PTH1 family
MSYPHSLIIGLGNPGMNNTPHNLGFMAVERYLATLGQTSSETFAWTWWARYAMVVQDKSSSSSPVMMTLRPYTCMNLSGFSLRRVLADPATVSSSSLRRIIVLSDDTNVKFGKVKMESFKAQHVAVAGGISSVFTTSHNGLRSVIPVLDDWLLQQEHGGEGAGGREEKQVCICRIGCGRRVNVLGTFPPEEREKVDTMLRTVASLLM